MNEEMLTMKEAAQLLGIKPQTLYAWKNKGKINVIEEKIFKVKKEEIEKLKKAEPIKTERN
jgi:excisionase family DNA binding protein